MTALVRLRLDIGYDGTDFAGWARQPGLRTVQGVIEEALARVLRLDPPPGLTVAGRTDAGVHALGQVAHVVVPVGAYTQINGTLPRRMAGVLPPDVRIWRIAQAQEGFDARFSALSRRYAYRVCDNQVGVDPMRRHEVLWHPRPLDLERMNAASALLLGEHDFAAFCRRREGATTIRRLLRYDWVREPGDVAIATVEADAFCHSMVRAIVGALLAVGDRRRHVEWPAEVLAAGVRDSAVQVLPPHGLSLEEVVYPDAPLLASRAQETRRVRVRGLTSAAGAAQGSAADAARGSATDAAQGSATDAAQGSATDTSPGDGSIGAPGQVPDGSGAPGQVPDGSGAPGQVPDGSGMPGQVPDGSGMPGPVPDGSDAPRDAPDGTGAPAADAPLPREPEHREERSAG